MASALRATVRAVAPRGAPRKAVVSLTPAAVGRLKELLVTRPGSMGLRVGVAERGCNGLTYTLQFADKKQPLDAEVQQDGVTVLVDNKALLSVIGTEMDFVEDAESLTAEFVFNNPNVKAMCGCKESFHV